MTNKKIPPENLLDPQQNSTLDGLLEMVIPKSKDGKMPGVNEIGFHEFIIDFNLNYYLHDLKEGLNSTGLTQKTGVVFKITNDFKELMDLRHF